jgi:hypothetical protein
MNGKQHQLKNKDYECGTWNVRTLLKPALMKSLLQQLKDCRIQMAAIQETKQIFYTGKEFGKREFGVTFVVDKSIKGIFLGFKAISGRICVLHTKSTFFNISVIHVHAPAEDKNGL